MTTAAPTIELLADPMPPRERWWSRRDPMIVWPSGREALRAVAVYFGSAAVTVLTFCYVVHRIGKSVAKMPARWDGLWYLSIAEHGYASEIPVGPDGIPKWTNLAFFPGYPLLVRATHEVTTLPYVWSAVTVSVIAAAVAAIGIFTLVRAVAGARAGYLAVAAWAVAPVAIVEWAAYTEGLATALTAWTLVALIDRRWVLAGTLTLLAGLVRPTTMALVATVLVMAATAVLARRDGWRPWLSAVLAPLGILTSWLVIGFNAGRLDAWFHAEKAWGQKFDFGRGFLGSARGVIELTNTELVNRVAVFALLAAAVCVLAMLVDRRVPLSFVVLSALTVFLTVASSSGFYSKPRFLLPILPCYCSRSCRRWPAPSWR